MTVLVIVGVSGTMGVGISISKRPGMLNRLIRAPSATSSSTRTIIPAPNAQRGMVTFGSSLLPFVLLGFEFDRLVKSLSPYIDTYL